MSDPAATLRRLAAVARTEGREWLLEIEAMEVAAALGLGLPPTLVTTDGDDLDDAAVAALGSDPVVVKAMAPGLIHKAAAGGVRTAAAHSAGVRRAIETIVGTWHGPPLRFLVQQHVAHDEEWLLGMRQTAAFGPIVTLGPGGSRTESLAAQAPEAFTLASPSLGPAPAVGHDGFARLLAFAAEMGEEVAEFEVNPMVVTADGPVALDAVLRLGSAQVDEPEARPLHKLPRLLEPESIAIVGVSRGENVGRMILRSVLGAGFPAERLIVVKPGAEAVAGCRCVPDLGALDGSVDLLVLSVAAHQVPDLVAEAIRLQAAESMILIPGGLGERTGSEEAVAQVATAIAGARQEPWSGPLVNGGNCLGVQSRPGSIDTFFIPNRKYTPGAAREEPVAVISQSGALVLSRLDRLPWLAPRYVVSVGNQIDLTVGDYLTHFAGAPDVDVAACYVEGFRPGDGLRFLTAAQRIRDRGGAVVLYAAGRTPAGTGAAASHTASVAGDYTVTRALARHCGVLVAETLAEWEDLLMLATLLGERRVDGLGLGAVSNAGFEAVAMADQLGPFTLAAFDPATISRLDEILDRTGLGALVTTRNPLDLTPVADDVAFADAAKAVMDDPGVDVGLIGCVPFTAALQTLAPSPGHDEDVSAPEAVASRLANLATDKAWAAVIDGGGAYDPMAALLLERGIPTFREADRAAGALARYCEWRRAQPR